MDYKVLYRKYRPKNFDEVIGQNVTINLLKDGIINNKISHAYIFSGPRGTGKTSTAKIFARTINCMNPNNGNACGKCDNCNNFLTNADIYEIDAASNTGVDKMREIIDNIKLTPTNSKYKVYIIDEVHMLSTGAFNALLLTLEEPPSHVVFILATTDIQEVPITVLSRCQRLDFRRITINDIVNKLREISDLENIDIDDDALIEIAQYSDGGLRDALSILDQLSKFNEKITVDIVLKTIGLVSSSQVENLLNYVENNDVDNIIGFVDKVRSISADYKTIIKKVIEVIKYRAIKIKQNDFISRLDYSDYKNLCFELASSIYKANVNIDSYSLMELILLNYVNNDVKFTTNNAIKDENGTKNISREIFPKEKTSSVEETKDIEIPVNKPKVEKKRCNIDNIVDIRINNCFVSATKSMKEKNIIKWNEFLQTTNDKKLKGLLIDSNIVLSSSDIIILVVAMNEEAEIINENLDQISESFNSSYKFAAISKDRWEKEMVLYKNNLKNNIKYVLKEEPKEEYQEDDIIDDIFDTSKIEVV